MAISKPRAHRKGIPRGCTLSNILAALLGYGPVQHVRNMILAVPRAFADEFGCVAEGHDAVEVANLGFEAILTFVAQWGGTVAVDKCRDYATTKAGRKTMRNNGRLNINRVSVSVVHDFRDLGAHVHTTLRVTTTTLTARFPPATACVKKIQGQPGTTAAKVVRINHKSHRMALYAAEEAAPTERALQEYTVTVATTLALRHST